MTTMMRGWEICLFPHQWKRDTDREGMGDEMFAPRKSIFDHPLIEKIHDDDGKRGAGNCMEMWFLCC